MKHTLQAGDIVTGIYKTGKYIGEITAVRPQHYLVKILAVLKHPTQGDLHSVKQVDVPLFHERRALSYREQTNIPMQMVKKYEGDVPDYKDSLRQALEAQIADLKVDSSPWAERCLENLYTLKTEYKL
jgi:kinase-associated protein B